MELEVRINGVVESVDVAPHEILLSLLRRKGCMSVKQGCDTGDCGACTVLVDGEPRPSCVLLAAQVGGATLTTVEGIGTPYHLHALQEAFRDMGAVQCGFCTPGMIVSAYALLKRNPQPTEVEVREALSSNLCRCTGYVKPVQAVLQAAAHIRGEQFSGEIPRIYHPGKGDDGAAGSASVSSATTAAMRPVQVRPTTHSVMGTSLPNIEANKLLTGQATFADDIHKQGMLHAAILTSPHAHAVIRSIDVSNAVALPGVHAVLTYKDIPRLPYAIDNSSGPQDHYSLDFIVRYVGDRVAAVAAETAELARQAIEQINVEYDILPASLDPRQSLDANAPRIHAESDSRGIADTYRNVAGRVRLEDGNVEQGFLASDVVVESEYALAMTHAAPIENHTTISYFDENGCLVVRSATQTPHLVRRKLAALLQLPLSRIRVTRPNVGGSFGTKQGIVMEDLCALLTLATHRPVRLALSRRDEFRTGRVQQRHIVRVKTGVRRDGTLVAQQMLMLASTGAYATHPLLRENQASPLALYSCQHKRFIAEVVYTNTPPSAGSYQVKPELFALECHMDEVAQRLGMDALELRSKNWSDTNGSFAACVQAMNARWRAIERNESVRTFDNHHQRGVGVALGFDNDEARNVSGATIMLNDEGTFDVYVAVADDVSKTLLAQIVAETLGVGIDAVILHCQEAATLPFSTVSDAAGTLMDTGRAIQEAANQIRQKVLASACEMGLLNAAPEELTIENGVIMKQGTQREQNARKLLLQEVAEHSIILQGKYVIASYGCKGLPFEIGAIHKAEVEVDVSTGVVRIRRVVTAVGGGRIINPLLAEGQMQGAVLRVVNAAMSEELLYDRQGQPLTLDLGSYRLYRASDAPHIQIALVEDKRVTHDANLFGAMSEVVASGSASAIVNAVANALNVRIRQLPISPERVLRILHAQNVHEHA